MIAAMLALSASNPHSTTCEQDALAQARAAVAAIEKEQQLERREAQALRNLVIDTETENEALCEDIGALLSENMRLGGGLGEVIGQKKYGAQRESKRALLRKMDARNVEHSAPVSDRSRCITQVAYEDEPQVREPMDVTRASKAELRAAVPALERDVQDLAEREVAAKQKELAALVRS